MAKKSKRSSARRRPGSAAARSSTAVAGSAAATRPPAPRVAGPTGDAPVKVEDDAAQADLVGDAEAAGAAPATPVAAAAATPAPPSRRVGRVDPATRRPRAAVASIPSATAELSNEDPSIPLARVPYTTGDLRRVVIIGGLMVMLIIVATVLVTVFIK
jgi:hypothetical protein